MTDSYVVTRLITDIALSAPGVTDDVVRHTLFPVIGEFCEDTNVWREDIPFTTIVGDITYDLAPSVNATINRLMWVVDPNNYAVMAMMDEPGVLELAAAPASAARYVATVALTISDPVKRTDSLPQLPDWVLSKYSDAFMSGALARLLLTPAKPYTNAQLGGFHAKKFNSAKSQARVMSQTRNLYRGTGWRFPSGFAAGRG